MSNSREDLIKMGVRTAVKFAESGLIKTPEEREVLEILMSDLDIRYYLETGKERALAREPFLLGRCKGKEIAPGEADPDCIYPTYAPSVGWRHINEAKCSWILAHPESYPLLINCGKKGVWVGGKRLHVSRRRFALLAILARLEGRAELDHILDLFSNELGDPSYDIQRKSLYEAKSDLLSQLNRQGQSVQISIIGEIMNLDEPAEFLFIDRC